MTALEHVHREKSDKRASETRKIAKRVAEEIVERRRRFFREAATDPELLELATTVLREDLTI